MKPNPQSLVQRLRGIRRAFQTPRVVFSKPALRLCEVSRVEGTVNHGDNGRFVLGLQLNERLSNVAPTFDLGARLVVEFRSHGMVHKVSCGADPAPYWSGSESGFIFMRYEVPEEVPQNVELVVLVTTPARNESYAKTGGVWFVRSDHGL